MSKPNAVIDISQGLKRPVNVLSTHSAWLLGSLAAGCNGLLSDSAMFARDTLMIPTKPLSIG